MATYHPVPGPPYVPPPSTPLPWVGVGANGPGGGNVYQPGGFTTAQYALWRGIDLTSAQACLDQAVIDGKVTLS